MAHHSSNILISVIGATGAGKTTFISKASGRNDLVVGHGIDSCTQEVQEVSFQHQGKTVTLFDTPGFDDSFTSDADILQRIAEHLGKKYGQGQLLNGVILLQPINGTRCSGNEHKRTRLFKKLLGEKAYGRVIIGTTMWGTLVDHGSAIVQEEQRMKNAEIWGDMIKGGASVVRHDNTTESALKLVEKIMGFPTIALQVQEELGRNGGRLAATSAGRQLDEDLGEVVQKLRKELDDTKKERDASATEMKALQAQIDSLIKTQYSIRNFVASHWNRMIANTANAMIKSGMALKGK